MPVNGRKGGDSNRRIVHSGGTCIDSYVPSVEEEKVTIEYGALKHILLRKGDFYYDEQQS